MEATPTFTAFAGQSLLASGDLQTALSAAKRHSDAHPHDHPLLFEDASGKQVDFDLRGSLEEVLARARPAPARNGPGRPRLGVVSREVSLLPRHWEWLEAQANGASAALRRLVDEARKNEPPEWAARRAAATTDRAMHALAGNLPGFEEASRALYAGDRARFEASTDGWPADVRAYLYRLARGAFPQAAT